MAKMRRRSWNGDRGPPRKRGRQPLSISFVEAAADLLMAPRTLLGLLKRTHASCLVRTPTGRFRLDRKGFYRWCRRMGFESALESRGGV